MRNYFRFLRFSKKKLILAVILIVFVYIVGGLIIPQIGCSYCDEKCAKIVFYDSYCTNETGARLVVIANSVLNFGMLVILYTVLSLVIYFVKGEWRKELKESFGKMEKNERNKKVNRKRRKR